MACNLGSLVGACALLLGTSGPAVGGPMPGGLAWPDGWVERGCPLDGPWLAADALETDAGQGLACPPDSADVANFAAPQNLTGTTNDGPDQYGYMWAAEPLAWIDATAGGTALDFWYGSSSRQVSGLVSLPFTFEFYENSYSSLYIAASGYVAFSMAPSLWELGSGPQAAPPDNWIAPFSALLFLNGTGTDARVYYASGGTAPNRYFVVEWYQVKGFLHPEQQQYTFELVLHEDGSIVFQYQLMQGEGPVYRGCGLAGIEDSSGLDRLLSTPYCGEPADFTALRFTRPAPAARVRLSPPYQGQFAAVGEVVSFTVPIRNLGELGPDTFDLTWSSNWPASLYAADGTTPLVDTDGDLSLDTGALGQGAGTSVVVQVQTPSGAAIGDHNTVALTGTASLDNTRSQRVSLQMAVPAPFVQVYTDKPDRSMRLYLAHPNGEAVKADKAATGVDQNGFFPAVTEAPDGSLVYVWSRARCTNATCTVHVQELEYALLDRYGDSRRAATRLTDHTAASLATEDREAAVAVAPDGRIGLLWYRSLRNAATSELNFNVYFAVLDAAGELKYGPVNVTNNALWIGPTSSSAPRYGETQISATDDNRFVLAWSEFHYDNPGGGCSQQCLVQDVYHAVRATNGTALQAPTQFTHDTPGASDSYSAPNLARLSDNRALLTFTRQQQLYYAVLDSDGSTVWPMTQLPTSATHASGISDAVELSDGGIVIAWTEHALLDSWARRVGYAVLDDNYALSAGPVALSNPAAATGDAHVSVAADGTGHAVLTWMDAHDFYRRNLYYALVNGDGALATPPMLFRTSAGTPPYMETNPYGFGNTTLSVRPTTGVDAWVDAASAGPSLTAQASVVVVDYGNHGLDLASGASVTVTLGGGLTWAITPPGNAPSSSDETAVWTVGDLDWLDTGQLELEVHIPNDAPGTTYPIMLTIGTDGSDVNGANNEVVFQLASSALVYLPMIWR